MKPDWEAYGRREALPSFPKDKAVLEAVKGQETVGQPISRNEVHAG